MWNENGMSAPRGRRVPCIHRRACGSYRSRSSVGRTKPDDGRTVAMAIGLVSSDMPAITRTPFAVHTPIPFGITPSTRRHSRCPDGRHECEAPLRSVRRWNDARRTKRRSFGRIVVPIVSDPRHRAEHQPVPNQTHRRIRTRFDTIVRTTLVTTPGFHQSINRRQPVSSGQSKPIGGGGETARPDDRDVPAGQPVRIDPVLKPQVETDPAQRFGGHRKPGAVR